PQRARGSRLGPYGLREGLDGKVTKSMLRMERDQMTSTRLLGIIAIVSFCAGLAWSRHARAEDAATPNPAPSKNVRVVYPKRTEIDFEGLELEGELRNPGEFYFQHRKEERFDSLVKRRKNFHREMLRDVVLSK